MPLYAEQPAPVAPFSPGTVVCRRYTLEQSPGQNFYHYDNEPVYRSVPVTLSDLISMAEAAPVAVVMPDFETWWAETGEQLTRHEFGLKDLMECAYTARLNGVKP